MCRRGFPLSSEKFLGTEICWGLRAAIMARGWATSSSHITLSSYVTLPSVVRTIKRVLWVFLREGDQLSKILWVSVPMFPSTSNQIYVECLRSHKWTCTTCTWDFPMSSEGTQTKACLWSSVVSTLCLEGSHFLSSGDGDSYKGCGSHSSHLDDEYFLHSSTSLFLYKNSESSYSSILVGWWPE